MGPSGEISRYGSRPGPIRVLGVPQMVGPGERDARPLLPSALYAPPREELEGSGTDDAFGDAPWVLGEHARRRGAEVPGRLVVSSKSWLGYAGVDRTADILPWGAQEGVPRSLRSTPPARVLAHVRRAWDAIHVDAPLVEQDVVLTVPASFDEVGRELTMAAAARAGLEPKLLEEPQAAFYEWMAAAGREGAERLLTATGGEALALVVDVGGGTTDLSLVKVSGADEVTRVAVGPHVLLGGRQHGHGDISHACEGRLADGGGKLDVARFAQLVGGCRVAKEAMLGAAPPDDVAVTVTTAERCEPRRPDAVDPARARRGRARRPRRVLSGRRRRRAPLGGPRRPPHARTAVRARIRRSTRHVSPPSSRSTPRRPACPEPRWLLQRGGGCSGRRASSSA